MTRTAAVIGAGTIGRSWAALFASHDISVRVQDPRPDVQDLLDSTAAELAEVLPGDLLSRMSVVPSLEDAVAGVDVVQENGPERLQPAARRAARRGRPRARHLLEHLGPGMVRRWRDLGQPELTPEVVEQISSDTESRFADREYATRTRDRDRVQLAVLAAREQARRDAGQGCAAHSSRRTSSARSST